MTTRSMLLCLLTFLLETASAVARTELPDTARMDILIASAGRHMAKQGHPGQDMDSAFSLIKEAEKINDLARSGQYTGIIELNKGIYYLKLEQKKIAKSYLDAAIRTLIPTGKYYSIVAYCYYELAAVYVNDSSSEAVSNVMEKAARYYHLAGHYEEAGNCYINAAVGASTKANEDSASLEYQRALEKTEPGNNKSVVRLCQQIASLATQLGNYPYALSYLMKGIKKIDTTDKERLDIYYFKIASAYYNSHLFSESQVWARRAAELDRSSGNQGGFYTDTHLIMQGLLAEKKPADALACIQRATEEVPPDVKNTTALRTVMLDFGKSYLALKEYDKAEPYYVKLDKLFGTYDQENKTKNEAYYNNLFYHYTTMASFYIAIGKFSKAQEYVDLIKPLLNKSVYPPTRINGLQLLEFTIDSAKANYVTAIRHYEAHMLIADSLFNVDKARQLSEMAVEYQAAKNAKDIALLQLQRDQQQSELQRANLQRNVIFGGAILLFVTAGFAYRSYRLKQRLNRRLNHKQKAIDLKNAMLSILVKDKEELLSEKDRLLGVKEILVKEVHNRVRNNLYMVSSLLESQSTYLQDQALEAVKKSQHRVQAISLIHQKLYSDPTLANVDMSDYLFEMLGYLRDSFVVGERILFQFDLDPITLDVIQAVPIGLIVNEAITNSIKYAFPVLSENDREQVPLKQGLIGISLKEQSRRACLLCIEDNGRGLSGDFGSLKSASLGMSLIKGLSKSLHAELCISSQSGTRIELIFDHHPA